MPIIITRSIKVNNYMKSFDTSQEGIKRRENDEFPSIKDSNESYGGSQLSRGHCERVLSGVKTQRDSGRGSALYTERTEWRQLEKGRQRQSLAERESWR